MTDTFDPDDYVGLPYEEAAGLARSRRWHPRRLTAGMVVTAEFRPDRLDLLVDEDDVVVEASRG